MMTLRHEVARFAACIEAATGMTYAFGAAYLSVYSELDNIPVDDQATVDRLEEKRAGIEEALLLMRDDDTAERERARLQAMYVVISLQYQIARGIRIIPEYNEAEYGD